MMASALLSIKPVFADKIYSGEKTYELRKSAPNLTSPRIFLFETEPIGKITGIILAGEIIKDTPENIWKLVGTSATSRERFFSYFQGRNQAVAIKIARAQKFSSPLATRLITQLEKKFIVPQSYQYLSFDSALHRKLLSEVINTVQIAKSSKIQLSELQPENATAFSNMAFAKLRPFYEEINHDFVKSLTAERAPGFSTLDRQVYEINSCGKLLGFTTITYKAGNCIKTGPTLFFDKHHNKGYGQELRKLLHHIGEALGLRKVYCTCPATNLSAMCYLLTSGYIAETTLGEHYKKGGNEIILSHSLSWNKPLQLGTPTLKCPIGNITNITGKKRNLPAIQKFIQRTMRETFFPVDEKWLTGIISTWKAAPSASSRKDRKLSVAYGQNGILAVLISIPKRGKTIKQILLADTSDVEGLSKLIHAAEAGYTKLKFRKASVYFRADDTVQQNVLAGAGYFSEGMLRAPFQPGKDFFIYSKHFPVN